MAGTQDNPIVANMLPVEPDVMLTVAAVGTPDNISLLSITDGGADIIPGKGHGTIYTSLSWCASRRYHTPGRNCDLPQCRIQTDHPLHRRRSHGTYFAGQTGRVISDIVLEIPNVPLTEDSLNTIYAVGLLQGDPQLEVLLTMDEI